uniref:Uncharacterized protein n=1 Tax=Mus spicilegus TaxID=10103 RepID=A0A8C6MQI6_MUSSI
MVKATRKSPDPTTDVESSTSSAKSKKAKTLHQPQTRTAGKKSRQFSSKSSGKVQKTTNKDKKTLPWIPKRKTSEKTTPPTKKTLKAKGKALFDLETHSKVWYLSIVKLCRLSMYYTVL